MSGHYRQGGHSSGVTIKRDSTVLVFKSGLMYAYINGSWYALADYAQSFAPLSLLFLYSHLFFFSYG